MAESTIDTSLRPGKQVVTSRRIWLIGIVLPNYSDPLVGIFTLFRNDREMRFWLDSPKACPVCDVLCLCMNRNMFFVAG